LQPICNTCVEKAPDPIVTYSSIETHRKIQIGPAKACDKMCTGMKADDSPHFRQHQQQLGHANASCGIAPCPYHDKKHVQDVLKSELRLQTSQN
jgi:hypothetical protein